MPKKWIINAAGKPELEGDDESPFDSILPTVKKGYDALSGSNESDIWKAHPKIHDILYGHQNEKGETVDKFTGRPLIGGTLPAASLGPMGGTTAIRALANAPAVQRGAAALAVGSGGNNAYHHFKSGEYGKLPGDIGEVALGALGLKYAGKGELPDVPEAPPAKKPLALPPAPRQPDFIASERSVIPNKPIPAPHGSVVDPDVALRNFDTHEAPPRSSGFRTTEMAEQRRQQGITGFTPESWSAVAEGRGKGVELNPDPMPAPNSSGDTRLGFNAQTSRTDLPYPENIVPNAVRPRTAQSNTNRLTPNRFKFGEAIPTSDIGESRLPDIPESPIESNFQQPELPSAPQLTRAQKVANLPEVEPIAPPVKAKPTEEEVYQASLQDPRESAGARNRVPLEDKETLPVRENKSPVRESLDRLKNDETGAAGDIEGDWRTPFTSRAEAETSAAELRQKGMQTFITRLEDGRFKITSVPKRPSLLSDESGVLNISSKSKPKGSVTGGANGGNSGVPEQNTNSTTSKNAEYRPIPEQTSVKDAVRQWADGRSGANVRAGIAKEKFSDLAGDKEAIDRYEAGDRTGRLGDVQKRLDELHKLGVDSGLFKADQKVNNYLRHEYENTAEEISQAVTNYVTKNPSIAKTREFPTYKHAEQAGLKRKFDNIPDVLHAYEQKLFNAVRQKELYDYLKTKGILTKGAFTTNPQEWSVAQTPEGKQFTTLIKNYYSESPSWLKKAADWVSTSKNLYLAGGAPGTKYNMHAYNIARSDAKLVGFGKATSELLSDPTGNKAVEVFKQHQDLLPKLVERGYTFHPVDDVPTRTPGNIVTKAMTKMEGAFEKPLFDKALPALKLKRTAEVYYRLLPKLGEEGALKEAAKIGNEFYGGINKTLRHSITNDAARLFFLAPDWLESRVLLAKRDYTGLAKTIVGKGSIVDNIGAKSMTRGLVMAGGTLAARYGAGKLNFSKDKPGDVLTAPIGKDGKKTREIDTFSTSDEGIRVPIQVAVRAYHGDPAGLIDVLIANRRSLPWKAMENIWRGQDDFGNPLKGKDKYGKKISGGKAIVNYLSEMSRPAQLQVVQGLLKYASGDASLEEVLSMGAELPVKYSAPPKSQHKGLGMSGLRMRSLGQ